MNHPAVHKADIPWWLIHVLGLLLALVGCATRGTAINQGINLRPLFFYERAEEGTDYQINALGPLFSLRRERGKVSLGLRPLFFYRELAEPESWELEYLYPLGRCRFKEAGERSVRLIPVFRWADYAPSEEGRLEFLTLFWGRSRQGTEYGGLFPLAGWLSQRFNQDRIHFFLWPVYWEATRDEATTHHILWPLISLTHGGGQRGSKLLPFYSYKEKMKDHTLDLAVLWPIYTMHKDEHGSRGMFLPLVARSESPRSQTTWLLWPFFSYSAYESGEQWNLPWPILNVSRGRDRQSFKLFPLFKTERAEGERSFYLLWPLYQFQELQLADGWERRHRVLLVDGLYSTQRRGQLRKDLNLWPLLRYVRERDGSNRLSIPVLFPIEDEGLARNYAPLITLFQRWEQADGTGGWDFLWGLMSYRKSGSSSVFELSFLYKYIRQKNRVAHSLLGGLIQFPLEHSSGPI